MDSTLKLNCGFLNEYQQSIFALGNNKKHIVTRLNPSLTISSCFARGFRLHSRVNIIVCFFYSRTDSGFPLDGVYSSSFLR